LIFEETSLAGVFMIEPERFEDVRGFFSRTWSEREFTEQGLNSRILECNISFNRKKGTLRGMHYQAASFGQTKLVRCTQGAIFDVAIDLRPSSPTYTQWVGVELSARNRAMLYIPEEFAHGFQTLEDNSEVLYQMSQVFAPESARGVRWNDSAFGIEWPLEDPIIIERDAQYPDFQPG
jgi:dTDP-4-dehydrorhamnose 3,5-epimerase